MDVVLTPCLHFTTRAAAGEAGAALACHLDIITKACTSGVCQLYESSYIARACGVPKPTLQHEKRVQRLPPSSSEPIKEASVNILMNLTNTMDSLSSPPLSVLSTPALQRQERVHLLLPISTYQSSLNHF
jgi:hypothetical protein